MTIDTEKVIKGLEHCIAKGKDCRGCIYYEQMVNEKEPCACRSDALDVIHDLQSQIAILVATQHTMAEIMSEKQNKINIEQKLDETYGVTGGICPTCGNWIQSAHSFCGFCGQPIGWKQKIMTEQGCAKIKEPDCRICGQSHCKYYHESRKPTECKSYTRMEGR